METNLDQNAELKTAPGQRPRKTYRMIAIAVAAVATAAGLALIVTQFADISAFAQQASNARPTYLGVAAVTQVATYFCVAFVWRRVLTNVGYPMRIRQLFPLALAKLFADQAAPSAGLSGAMFFLHALGRRGVPQETAFAVFVFVTASFFVAFGVAAISSLFALAREDNAPGALASIFAGVTAAILIIFVIACLGFIFRLRIPSPVKTKFEIIHRLAQSIRMAKNYIRTRRVLFFEATLVQLTVRLIDGATLALLFYSIGSAAPFSICFFAVVIASLAATIAPAPMGLGTFEAGMIAALSAFGVPLESAVTSTVLYRGLSLWAPLLPGFYIIQREILGWKLEKAPEA